MKDKKSMQDKEITKQIIEAIKRGDTEVSLIYIPDPIIECLDKITIDIINTLS